MTSNLQPLLPRTGGSITVNTKTLPSSRLSKCKGASSCSRGRSVLFLALAGVVGAIALILGNLFPKTTTTRISDELTSRLRSFNIPVQPSSVPTTYVDRSRLRSNYSSAAVFSERPKHKADTTAVLLNWSRLENVKLLSALLCGPWLDDTIAEVFIWNNNPSVTLTMETFQDTGCSSRKLHIYNSPSNVLFQARFLACAQARTPYCFTQVDDDYLVQPEVIKNIHKYMAENTAGHSLHLLPPHEHLLSRLRTFTTGDGMITTGFAWLGHGTYLKRSSAERFLDLLGSLNVSEDEMKMADNYFTILANRPKKDEVWFDHGIELGGGQPFTVGSEGDSRNDEHIAHALEYLSELVSGRHPASDHPYVSTGERIESPDSLNFAPCRVGNCVITSNIELLPVVAPNEEIRGSYLESVRRRKLHDIDTVEREWYFEYPLSSIVDGNPHAAFSIYGGVRAGDWIVLDVLRTLDNNDRALELVLLTEVDAERMFLRETSFSTSLDGREWSEIKSGLDCVQVDEKLAGTTLIECSIKAGTPARYFKIMVIGQNLDHTRWIVHEMWLRYLLP